ncbi:MAG TPA: SPOR domain-containing protein [Rhodothermales bacterium]
MRTEFRKSVRIASIVWLMAFAVGLAGCAGSRKAADDTPAGDELDEEVVEIVHADYEDFDPTPYRERAPESEALVHDVPDRLMSGRVGSASVRTLDGYRIQVFQTQDPSQADEYVDQATDWWFMQKQAGAPGSLFSRESAPVYSIWRQPYYRIRIGDFASRDAAEAALEEIRGRFSGAFVVPDRVTVGP